LQKAQKEHIVVRRKIKHQKLKKHQEERQLKNQESKSNIIISLLNDKIERQIEN